MSLTLLKNHLILAKKILITCHNYPDIDAIGSCLALAHHLKNTHDVTIWIPKENLSEFDFLPKENLISSSFPEYANFDTCIICDCSNLERVNQYSKLQHCNHSFTTINIDHHPDNNHFGDINIVENISSVGELLYNCFKKLNWDITSNIAQCLYAAISFDTGRFSYSNVTYKTFLAASSLVQNGASPVITSRAIDENKTKNDFLLLKVAIDNLIVSIPNNYAYTTIPKKSPKGSIKIIDTIRQLKDIELVIVFQELQSKLVKVNLRSKDSTNVSEIAQKFGGGGHERAAGILFKQDLETPKLELLQFIQSR